MITDKIIGEAQAWHDKYNKPVLIAEYGADTFPGLHEVNIDQIILNLHTLHFNTDSFDCYLQLPEYIWSEEYQVQVMSNHFKAFDQLREKGFFIGEFIWNFADFRTAQSKY